MENSLLDLPATILLILPGYLGVFAFFLRTHVRRISAFEIGLWSLLAAAGCLALTLGLWQLGHVLGVCSLGNPPSFLTAVSEPAKLPPLVWMLLYAESPVLGVASGRLMSTDQAKSTLRRVSGIDLLRHEDVWTRVNKKPAYCVAYLADHTTLFGWVETYSRDRNGASPEIYLTLVHEFDAITKTWTKRYRYSDSYDGTLIDTASVTRLDFFPVEQNANGSYPEMEPPKLIGLTEADEMVGDTA